MLYNYIFVFSLHLNCTDALFHTKCYSTGARKMLGAENETIKLDKLGHKVTAVGGVCVGPDMDISNLNSWIATL